MKHLKYLALVIPILWLATATLTASAEDDNHCIVVYFQGDSQNSVNYVQNLEATLRSAGVVNIVKYDYSKDTKSLRDLTNLRDFFDVPNEFFGGATVFVDGKYIFEGLFPIDVIVGFVNSNPGEERFIAAEGRSSNKYLLRQDDQTYEFSSSQGIVSSLSQVDTQNQLFTATQYLTLIIIVAVIATIALKKRKH